MDSIILRTFGVTKAYKNSNVLDGINMSIRRGQIYGLIGLNGAGKTTLMRVISGLVTNYNGNIELFGESNVEKIQKERSRMGCLIETPAPYYYKTVYENLEIERLHKGIPGKECIEKVLKLVDLVDFKDKKIKNLSVGTKQRVGIAMALLGDPEFLILDEPINGLDPVWIIEIRELLKRLNKEVGVTILISSHILEELHQLANCYGIIHKGKLIEQITDKELDEKCKKFLHIKVDNIPNATVILNTKLKTSNFTVLPNNIIKLHDYVDNSGTVAKLLFSEGIIVEEIMPMGDSLESYFSKVIGGVLDD
ncbi:ABC-2 type transport system ATP-binding protein [Clostridium cavendishii DSM 21758]|uniref:ABC-2 type transport system ATP-binding protein n=1 Tax=Clostridium cavendishii DSM 21758 TaxID=1121302 RepID=A0A1M6DE35_9CLOT|nr:ABC transporter ATP-binding protein [Clostridium cavendishii]SHI71311.1 ABC-2 type transport system ATP-binding protein [Clostridium cavendishii DSM 21758]